MYKYLFSNLIHQSKLSYSMSKVLPPKFILYFLEFKFSLNDKFLEKQYDKNEYLILKIYWYIKFYK